MLGMDYTSSRRYFIQSSIITENLSKINPFLKKIFSPDLPPGEGGPPGPEEGLYRLPFPHRPTPVPGLARSTLSQERVSCQPPYFSQKFRPRQNASSLKKWPLAGSVVKKLCHPSCFSTGISRCGKLLWKSLWRMWKTHGNPQLFFFSPSRRLPVQKLRPRRSRIRRRRTVSPWAPAAQPAPSGGKKSDFRSRAAMAICPKGYNL